MLLAANRPDQLIEAINAPHTETIRCNASNDLQKEKHREGCAETRVPERERSNGAGHISRHVQRWHTIAVSIINPSDTGPQSCAIIDDSGQMMMPMLLAYPSQHR